MREQCDNMEERLSPAPLSFFGALLQVSHLYYFGFTLAALIAPFSASQRGAIFRETAPKAHCTLPAPINEGLCK